MKDYSLKNDFLGELIGSYILVLFGTGAVAAAVLYDAHQSLFQIGMLWAFAVTFGIYMTRNLSNAHFNPAVTVAMVLTGRMSAKRLPTYILGQFIGAFLGGLTVYGVYGSSIAQYEAKKNIVRGTFESVTTAKMFGEYSSFNIFTTNFDYRDLILCAVMILPVLVVSILKEKGINVLEKLENKTFLLRWLVYYFLILAIIIFGIYGEGFNPKDFIYGGF